MFERHKTTKTTADAVTGIRREQPSDNAQGGS